MIIGRNGSEAPESAQDSPSDYRQLGPDPAEKPPAHPRSEEPPPLYPGVPVWRSVPTVEGVPTPRVVILTLDEAAKRVRLEARHNGYAGESVRAYVEMPMAGSYLEEALQVLRGALAEAEEEARRRDLAFAAAQPGSLS